MKESPHGDAAYHVINTACFVAAAILDALRHAGHSLKTEMRVFNSQSTNFGLDAEFVGKMWVWVGDDHPS